uniref:Uncharacterized protein n=1 Tax=Noctiluca scintillans TaxID=2966 RepID=A0A7S1A6X0_NOCSC|mmetsp:Transcript_34097/g.90918  ORF Transcript_34097/g.90918 Transcript_34097/m.90918 type:complete len:175 (+) Transcript_34097:57-581(+)|eukprot:CAMPEP_0194486224 /NCGR_PEP_ID=MMETSP0253-20130528/6960_1 /TAXON_ID=2966 /ORGANISM="Noctiluca scintillans" /LENGTH=174 /DNA_ID=CAMNT_0039326295 /DNA_START=36 /DNA_END=560 /DNA_ORIENTATION=-
MQASSWMVVLHAMRVKVDDPKHTLAGVRLWVHDIPWRLLGLDGPLYRAQPSAKPSAGKDDAVDTLVKGSVERQDVKACVCQGSGDTICVEVHEVDLVVVKQPRADVASRKCQLFATAPGVSSKPRKYRPTLSSVPEGEDQVPGCLGPILETLLEQLVKVPLAPEPSQRVRTVTF